MTSAKKHVQVVVVGAGPSGLALAIELGLRSISCLVIEKNDRVGYAPRAKTSNVRTREHLRRWGIANRLAQAAPFGVDYPSNVVFVTRLAGREITRFENALFCSPERDERYSEHSQWIPQYKLEEVMLERALSLRHVEVAFNREFLDFQENDDGIVVRTRDLNGGEEITLQADYLVGADGARSVVREQIGARMVGQYGLSRNYNTIFEAPGLAEAQQHGPAIMFWQMNTDAPSILGPMDVGDRWFFMPTGVPAGIHYTEDETIGLIRDSTGIDLPYRILSSDEWVASTLVSDRYSRGKTFLIGDACHLHPPYGGYGMNMGIADGVDLGWKLAAMLQGWGGPAIIDSVLEERAPAHRHVIAEAERNHALNPNQLLHHALDDDSLEGRQARAKIAQAIQDGKRAEFFGLGVILGYCYQGSPIIVDDGTAADWRPALDYIASATPGCLAPHHWLEDDRSLYDLFGLDFTLLVLDSDPESDDAIVAAREEANALGTPLEIVRLDNQQLRTLYAAPLALVRPDQIIAWRGRRWPTGLLGKVTGFGQETVSTPLIGQHA
ncbi:MAG TPA: FAD-dependent monooxygenase [Sphingobium sp.]